ncbi:MAG: monovalent cation/H(+) antiporter subunit G [Planctomycetota bacterium]
MMRTLAALTDAVPADRAVTATGVLDLLAAFALLVGLFFVFVGAVGVFRMPDAYHRIHASSKCTTLGLTGMLVAACLHLGGVNIVSKAVITIVFTFIATPIGSHLLSKAAHRGGLPTWEGTLDDEYVRDGGG